MNKGNTAKLESIEDVKRETMGRIASAQESWARTMYSESVPQHTVDRIKAKLNITNGRLKDVPMVPRMKWDLYDPLVNIIQSIVAASGNAKHENMTREVMHTRGKRLVKQALNTKMSPDIVIKATGNSFELPRTKDIDGVDATSVGYTNVTTVIEVKLDHTTNDDAEFRIAMKEVQRMGVYAKEIFAQQPNRLFVRFLVITQARVRLIQYDRAGALYSPLINYHNDPDTLIRLVVGLSSVAEVELGLDDTIRWESRKGKKIHGSVIIYDEKADEYRQYKMRNIDPFWRRDALFGRATRMWDVVDGNKQRLLVKDAWIAVKGTTPEHILLAKAANVIGVQQLVDYEDRAGTEFGEIEFLRPAPEAGKKSNFENMTFQRIVTVRYGEALHSFKTEREVLTALRDAIAAHERLIDVGVLHCDISLANILFGVPGASEGLRGILIDLDIAVEVKYGKKITGYRTAGTQYSLSQLLQRGKGRPWRPAHDYLDDLESFFWVLIHIIFDRVQHSQTWTRDPIKAFSSVDMMVSGGMKRAFLSTDLVQSKIPDCWTPKCKDMVIAFHDFMREIAIQKERIVGSMKEKWDPAPMQALHTLKSEHYGKILEMMDSALDAIGSDRSLPRVEK
ncbi:hypothetical protein D9611_011836 [Ephemerocybe angulata]|uniref:Fungal-type protein kinase domain-containing protein n=1 Tax=Ephemerocybe angulata TaxID=980116 RepID=A0A8H5FC17_9AGAR|nr:hypothetical protein D9611_011836 [Tulosesus angulatus]